MLYATLNPFCQFTENTCHGSIYSCATNNSGPDECADWVFPRFFVQPCAVARGLERMTTEEIIRARSSFHCRKKYIMEMGIY
jgi:hypothetical protein